MAVTLEKLIINVIDEHPEISRYKLNVNRIPSNGGIAVGAGLYPEGTTAEIEVKVDSGFTFAGWTGDIPAGVNSTETKLSIEMDANRTLNAYFARIHHTVEAIVTPIRHGYVTGGGQRTTKQSYHQSNGITRTQCCSFQSLWINGTDTDPTTLTTQLR